MIRTHRKRLGFIASLTLTVFVVGIATPAAGQTAAGGAVATPAASSVRGRIVGEGGRPVSGAFVRASSVNELGFVSGEVQAISDREGAFELKNVPEGSSMLRVSAPPNIVVDGLPESGVRAGSVLTIRMARGAVITGRVVDEAGKPMTGLRVTPEFVRDERGVSAGAPVEHRGGLVDDRGVYRLFGLQAGTYVVSAGHLARSWERPSFVSDRAPTYYPSASRSAASEVTVRLGEEAPNIDIRFRGEDGHRISGTIVGVGPSAKRWTLVELIRTDAAQAPRSGVMSSGEKNLGFSFDGLENGEYEIQASTRADPRASSEPVRIRVNGADVSDVTLTLRPQAQISGAVEFDIGSAGGACGDSVEAASAQPVRFVDVWIGYRNVSATRSNVRRTGLKTNGKFAAANLSAGRYRLWTGFVDDDLYLAKYEVVSPDAAGRTAPSASARDGVAVAGGQTVEGLRFVVGRGAARVRGRIAPATAGEPLPTRVRVCLVPADPKQKDDVIHFSEVNVERDGTFDVRNVAPGDYFVTTRVFPNDNRPDREILPAAWDAKERAALRAAAEKAGVRVTLSRCQRLESAVVTVGAKR